MFNTFFTYFILKNVYITQIYSCLTFFYYYLHNDTIRSFVCSDNSYKKDKLELKITFLRRNCCHLSDKKNVHMYMYLQKKTKKQTN